MDTLYEFGPFRLDISAEILFRGADPMPVGRRAVAVLRALLERPGVPISKDALMQAAWPGLAVEEGNLTVQVAALRRVLGDEPGADRWTETLPRRAYRFVGSVTTSNGSVGSTPASERATPLPSDRPSIAVLPFQNMSEAPEQDYFADAMVEGIITALSRIRRLFVQIARNSLTLYPQRSSGGRETGGKELGVSYVLKARSAGWKSRSHNRTIAGRQLRCASLGRSFRWHDGGCLRASGQRCFSVAGVIEPTLERRKNIAARSDGRPMISRPMTFICKLVSLVVQ